MRRTLFCGLVLFPLSSASGSAQTLGEAEAMAIQNSPTIRRLQAELKLSEVRQQSIELGARPTFGIAGGAEYEGRDDEQEFLPLAYGYVNYTLYDGNQISLQQKLAAQEQRALLGEAPFHEREIRSAVRRHFLRFAYHKDLIKIIEAEKKAVERLKITARQRQNAGLIGDSEVLAFDLRASELDSQVETLNARIRSELTQLSRLTRRQVEPSDASVPQIQDIAIKDFEDETGDTLVQVQLRGRKEAYAIQRDLDASRWNPQVEIETRAGRLPSEGELDNRKARVDALLIAKWEIFTGGRERALDREAVARRASLDALAEESLFETEGGNLEILQRLQELKLRSESQGRRKKPAKTYYDAMRDEYRRGVKNSPDVAHATETLFEIDRQLLELRFEWASSALEWEGRTGKSLGIKF